MKERTLQILRYMALPCMLGCLSLHGDNQNSDMQMDSSSKSHFQSTYERIESKEITPNAGPNVNNGADVYILADYILWHASEGGLAYAVTNGTLVPNVTPTSNNNTFSQGQRLAPHFKTRSGFKVGLGVDFDYDGWDLGATYTWLHSHATSSFGAPVTGQVNIGLWEGAFAVLDSSLGSKGGAVTFAPIPTTGSANWRLHFNVIDLELGRNYFISPKLTLRPHFGFKGTWQKQTYNVAYNQTGRLITFSTGSASSTTAAETFTAYNTQHYWGLGVRTGVNAAWMMTRCWSFFGDWAISALWGQFNGSRQDITNVTNSTTGAAILTNTTMADARFRLHQLNGVIETVIGLRYDYWFSDDDYRFRIQAGWENQLWFNQNHFENFGADNLTGDLSLQGFTLNLRFDF